MHQVRYVAGGRDRVHLAEPADTAFARGRRQHAKIGRTDSRHLGQMPAEGRLPGAIGAISRPEPRAYRLGAAGPRGLLPPVRPGGRNALRSVQGLAAVRGQLTTSALSNSHAGTGLPEAE